MSSFSFTAPKSRWNLKVAFGYSGQQNFQFSLTRVSKYRWQVRCSFSQNVTRGVLEFFLSALQVLGNSSCWVVDWLEPLSGWKNFVGRWSNADSCEQKLGNCLILQGEDDLWHKDIDQSCNQIYHPCISSGIRCLVAVSRGIEVTIYISKAAACSYSSSHY